jgi:hypothetical protein
VSGPATTVKEAQQLYPNGLPGNAGDSEPAAFVDDVPGRASPPYVYVVHTYNPGPPLFAKDPPADPQFPNVQFDLSISRAQLNGGGKRLKFYHWYLGGFTEPGLGNDNGGAGGREDPIFPALNNTPGPEGLAAYKQCLTPRQSRSDASISYSEETHEYLLLFVCTSASDPSTETTFPPQDTSHPGGTWFFSTLDAEQYDLSAQQQWSPPQQMLQSSTTTPAPGFWSPYQSGGGCMADLDGWYPSMMSAGSAPGHLKPSGWVFYMSGCEGGGSGPAGRIYSTRFFTITTISVP